MGKQEQRIEELENLLAEANLDKVSLQEEVQSYQQTIASFPGVKADYDAQLQKMEDKHKSEVEGLKNLLKATETSVNRRVIEALASIGVAQFAPEEIISSPASGKELHAKFLSLKGEEQTEFYRKHEKELSKFLHAK